MNHEDPLELPIDGVLDLHTFRPQDIAALLGDYLEACWEKEIYTVRIVHGKGIGTLRELVRAQLKKNPLVTDFHLAGEGSGGWGATIAQLRPRD